MTLDELRKAIDELIAEGIADDEPVCIEVCGLVCELESIAVVVQSDNWLPGAVVCYADLIDTEGEADDG